jgi:hypothetical protein
MDMTDADELALLMGKILANLQSFEFALRLFLYETVGPKDASLQLHRLTVGEWVSENPITNYDTLSVLISKVNEQLDALGIGERIDDQLVALRDAFAHGRTSALEPTGPFTLLKFSTARKGKVQVTTVLDLTPQWLAEQTARTHAELMKVVRIGRSIGLQCFPE